MIVAAALKWVDTRPEVDPLSGAVSHDERAYALSPADQAALEWALRLAEAWQAEVLAVTAGPPSADAALRDALAAGATSACRVDLPASASSDAVAAALASALASCDTLPALVVCGDASVDRGSGSVPVFLAARLGMASALGLVAVSVAAGVRAGAAVGPEGAGPDAAASTGTAAALEVERRLDRGKRERLAVTLPAVISVEGATAALRRAHLRAVLAARSATIEVVSVAPGTAGGAGTVREARRQAYRPRARELAGPDPASPPRERLLHLTGALSHHEPPKLIEAAPAEAAEAIVAQLRSWGYLEPEG